MAEDKTRKEFDLNLDGDKVYGPRKLWWTLAEEEAGPEAVRTFRDIESSLEARRQQMLRQARVWSNSWIGTLYDLASARLDRKVGPWNVCASAVSTAISMICRSPVKVTLETSGAEYSLQRLAKDSTRWLYGVLAENKMAEKIGPTIFQDAAVCDVGVAVVRVVDKKITIDRVFPDEVIVSEIEALYGDPYQIAIKTYRPKHAIMSKYGETEDLRAAIDTISIEAPGNGSATGYQASLIPVWECWSKNGKHLIAVNECTLECENWEYDFLPLVPLYIEPPAAGWYGRGYVQQLLGYQLELWAVNDAIDEHINLMTAARWVLEANSGIDPDDLSNEIGSVLTKNKGADNPHLLVGQVSRDLLEEREKIYNRALEEIGMNSWSISGGEPASRSGVAMTTARDKERGRLLTPGLAYEAFHVALAEVCFALGAKTAGTSYAGRGPADKSLDLIDFKKIAKFLKDAPWKVRPFPVSALPDDPDGKRTTVESWLKMGLITGPVAVSLLDLPDVDAESSLISSAREDIMWSIEEILDRGRDGYVAPEAMQDLELGKRMFAASWLKGRRQGVDQTKLDLLERWVQEAVALQKPPEKVQVETRPGVGEAPTAVKPVAFGTEVGGAPAGTEGPPGEVPPGAGPPGEMPPEGAPPEMPPGVGPPEGTPGAPQEMPPGIGGP